MKKNIVLGKRATFFAGVSCMVIGIVFYISLQYLIGLLSINDKYMNYCSDGQFIEGLEMFSGEVLYEKGDYLAVSGYYQYSEYGFVGVCDSPNCDMTPNNYIYDSGYGVRVFQRQYCISSNPINNYKDMIADEKRKQEEDYLMEWDTCKIRYKEQYGCEFVDTNIGREWICRGMDGIESL